MRLSPNYLLGLILCLFACNSASASSNPLIGTWTSTDKGCASKYTFAEKTMSFEDPGLPGLVPPSTGTAHVAYAAGEKKVIVQNLSTGVADSWILSDSKHAISGAVAQCHYVKQ